MSGNGLVAAVDLGATSGRVMVGRVGPRTLEVHAVARFANGPVRASDGLHWDIDSLHTAVRAGLASAAREAASQGDAIRSIGIDSWAVDYALLKSGRMLGAPFHYRDERTAAGVAATHALVSEAELYAANGLQFLPFNTLYQLAADRASGALGAADSMLLIPDLLAFWLSGVEQAERTNASTTGLLGVRTGEWDTELIAQLGLPRSLFPRLVDAGESVAVLPDVARELGLDSGTQVTAVGSHDTASAVVAVPATGKDFAYISCGTWGLVGVELEHPVLSEESRAARFTNERGIDGRVRYLHNVMGLWLLNESVRAWHEAGETIDLADLLAAAAAVTAPVPVFDANDERFLAPGDMPARITAWFGERGVPAPSSRAEMTRSILESLATAFASAVRTAQELSGAPVRVIHLVGGGALNELLCQLTANHSGLPVLAGPVEATALGNVLVQARAHGVISGDLEALRALVAATHEVRTFSPHSNRGAEVRGTARGRNA